MGEFDDDDRRFRRIWDALQRKQPGMPRLLEISLKGIRGINDLRVEFPYPVSVLAGSNGSGKSTVLFAAACAYKVADGGMRKLIPSSLFPDYQPQSGKHKDERFKTAFKFEYLTPNGTRSMELKRTGKKLKWSRSFFGRKGVRQPERPVYLRTLTNLTNPSEVRGVLRLSYLASDPLETLLTPNQIKFAQRLLLFKYSMVADLGRTDLRRGQGKNLLVATQEGGTRYSELHMAAGERAILRLSKDIEQLEGGLVLIDEVEAGLHPFAQKILMLELQELALRKDLQIIVTTHSPVVLDAVPETGRIFLERNEKGEVLVRPPYRALIQDSLYGRLERKFKLLCEDDVAQGVLHGVFDAIIPSMPVNWGSIRIDRDTGADEFPMHVRALKRFGQLGNIIFVLDGDKQDTDIKEKIISALGGDKQDRSDEEKEQDWSRYQERVMFLPGEGAPEEWVWNRMRAIPEHLAIGLGLDRDGLVRHMELLDAIYDSAAGSSAEITKVKMLELSEIVQRSVPEICRIVTLLEAKSGGKDLQPLMEQLKSALQAWRTET